MLKSQALVESSLNPDAESSVGAKGIMQIMPPTFQEIRKKYKFIYNNINDPRWNIAAGVLYDSELFNQWISERPYIDRLALTLASYNGGLGNVLKAQKICFLRCGEKCKNNPHKCNGWFDIANVANLVKTWKSKESKNYVNKIFFNMEYQF